MDATAHREDERICEDKAKKGKSEDTSTGTVTQDSDAEMKDGQNKNKTHDAQEKDWDLIAGRKGKRSSHIAQQSRTS